MTLPLSWGTVVLSLLGMAELFVKGGDAATAWYLDRAVSDGLTIYAWRGER